ncbi:uncharacterized protein BKA55DRAFT_559613 [Fusarium redolens]|uniref:Uncharacterized protein n=1 Tax=Fusarium redolens TaxID=48865 RepID=A0A9P9KFE5_FUSRE|nr:uncharacterized protein BKA55DRAFT_559613 [Fusarium redolens]KAH7260697.1 hypothetical protein BKA55DRAFT_559613 [Fusarium redolens]
MFSRTNRSRRCDTAGIHGQYTNVVVYADYNSIMAYHNRRPSPPGNSILRETTILLIEVTGDGGTAKGFWLIAGVESGLDDPKNVGTTPEPFMGLKIKTSMENSRHQALDIISIAA